jgi:hypothetical protein
MLPKNLVRQPPSRILVASPTPRAAPRTRKYHAIAQRHSSRWRVLHRQFQRFVFRRRRAMGRVQGVRRRRSRGYAFVARVLRLFGVVLAFAQEEE